MNVYIFFVLIGLAAGILSGLFGIGGGIVIVPALILLFQFSQVTANGISLASLLLPVGILAVLKYHKEGLVDIRKALIIGLGIFIGVVGGSISALKIPSSHLKLLYGIFLVYTAWTYIDVRSLYARQQEPLPDKLSEPKILPFRSPLFFLLLGIIAGILAGLFGIGGGIIIVPALISIFKYRYKMAVGTSLMALLLPVNLPGVLIYYQTGQLKVIPALLIGLGLVFGALLGALIAIDLPSKLIKRIYGIFILLIGLNFIFQFPGINP